MMLLVEALNIKCEVNLSCARMSSSWHGLVTVYTSFDPEAFGNLDAAVVCRQLGWYGGQSIQQFGGGL